MPALIQITNGNCTGFKSTRAGIIEFLIADLPIQLKVDNFFSFSCNGSTSRFETNINPPQIGNMHAPPIPRTSDDKIARGELVICKAKVPGIRVMGAEEYFTEVGKEATFQGDASGFYLRFESKSTMRPFPNRFPNLALEITLLHE